MAYADEMFSPDIGEEARCSCLHSLASVDWLAGFCRFLAGQSLSYHPRHVMLLFILVLLWTYVEYTHSSFSASRSVYRAREYDLQAPKQPIWRVCLQPSRQISISVPVRSGLVRPNSWARSAKSHGILGSSLGFAVAFTSKERLPTKM